DLTQLLAEAAAHLNEFDQIAFNQGAYGDYRLIFTWLVMREYAYSRRGDGAQAPPCCFSPEDGKSVFRLVFHQVLSFQNMYQLVTICRCLDGPTRSAVLRDSDRLRKPMGPYGRDPVSLALSQFRVKEPEDVRFMGGGIE
ncbi:MAG: hypothetical protein LBD36_00985, partial [Holosporales bacterium]|nr:hypothetical protein [Holosporales bacterium]